MTYRPTLTRLTWLPLCSTLTFGWIASAANAQAGASSPAVELPRQGGVEDIVVTARKRTERLQDVPIAVTALSRERIDRYDLTSLERIATSTPQLTVGRGAVGSGAQLTLRGIGASYSSIGIEQSVAVVVDGVYYGQGRVINEGFFDLERVEVLKGPQALFFGKNATAGVVSLSTASPTDHFEAMARGGYEIGSRAFTGEGFVSMPLSETLGVRLALRGSKMFGGYFRNRAQATAYNALDIATGTFSSFTAPPGDKNTPQEKDALGRLTVKWQPDERLTATLKVSAGADEVNNPGWNLVAFACDTGFSTLSPNTRCGRHFDVRENALPAAVAATIPDIRADGSLFNVYKSFAATSNLEYNIDDLSITSTTNYNWNRNRYLTDGDFQASSNQTFVAENTNWRAFSSELRALTKLDGPINVLGGFYYQNTRREFGQSVITGIPQFTVEDSTAAANRYLTFTKDSRTNGETLSPFGQIIWRIAPELEATGGVRYTHETKSSYFIHPYVNALFLTAFVQGKYLSAKQTFKNWSPDATISYRPNPNLTIYGAYKTAYKSGGFSNSAIYSVTTTVDDITFDSEKAKGFEIGAKTMLLDRQLRLNITAYNYKFSNLQIDFFDPIAVSLITTNAGAARTKGIEAEFDFAPRAISGISVHGTANYNHARYGRFIAPCYAGQTPAAGCVSASPGGSLGQNLGGIPTANAPNWTASLGGLYETAIGEALRLSLSADARYSDHYLTSGFGNPLSRQQAYASFDASIRLASTSGRWEAALLGKNLTNRFVATSVVDGPSTGSGTGTAAGVRADQIGSIMPPRTVRFQITLRY